MELTWRDGSWIARVALEAPNDGEAEVKAWRLTESKLALFEVFMAGLSTPFSLYPIPGNVSIENLDNGSSSQHVSVGGLGISFRATVMVTSSIGSAVSALNSTYGAIQGKGDCEVALYYYNRAMRESDKLHRFLDSITTIEAMLSETPDTTEMLARRLAVIVSVYRTDMQKTYDDFRGFYKTRSNIVHGEKIGDLSTTTVDEVTELARLALRGYLLMRDQLSEKDLKKKLDRFFDNDSITEIRRITTLPAV